MREYLRAPEFAAERRIIGTGLAVLVLLAILAVLFAPWSARPLLATNGVGAGTVVTTLDTDTDEVCFAETVFPAGTAALQVDWAFGGVPRSVTLTGEVALRDGARATVAPTAVRRGNGFLELPLTAPVKREARGTLCLTRSGAGPPVEFVGSNVLRRAGERGGSKNGEPIRDDFEPSLRMLASRSSEPSLPESLDELFVNLAHLSPSGLPPAVLAAIMVAVVPAILLVLLWSVATAPHRSVRRTAVVTALASLVLCASWATLAPTFQGPDEPEHFAFAQHLAATGERVDSSKTSTRAPYSTQLNTVLSELRHNAVVIDEDARNPWTSTTSRDVDASDGLPEGDGGGFTESASGHSALYYALLSPAIHLAGDDLERQLWFSRLLTALIACTVAGFAVLAAATLAPRFPRFAALAGVVAATFPIAGHVGGSVNNDSLLNAIAAALFFVVLRLLVDRDGVPAKWFAAAGALLILTPVAKAAGIGIALTMLAATVVAGVVRRTPRAIAASAGATLAGAAAAVAAGWLAAKLVSGQVVTLFNVHPAVPGTAAPTGDAVVTFAEKLVYIQQSITAPLHLGTYLFPAGVPVEKVYLRGIWGGFGWNRFYLEPLFYRGLSLVCVIGVICGLVALWRNRGLLAGRHLAALLTLLTPVAQVAFVAYAYATDQPRTAFGEQGRYLMAAAVPLAILMAGAPAIFAAGRWRHVAVGLLTGLVCVGPTLGMWIAVRGWAA